MIDCPEGRQTEPSLAAVVVAYGTPSTLTRCVDDLLRSKGVDLEIVVVDNGCDPALIRSVSENERVRIVGPPVNRGFASGCNVGVAQSSGDYIALINSDAYVAPDALARLVDRLADPTVGVAMASLRLADQPTKMNSAGNVMHLSGISWVGGFEDAAALHGNPTDVLVASGAACALSRQVWDRLGGFDATYFAYLEDTELSLRVWLAGMRVVFVPQAVVLHDYDFGRHPSKFYLIERNRLLMMMTVFRIRTLVVLSPVLVMVEMAMFLQAAFGGWLRAKVRATVWLLLHIPYVVRRRRVVQAGRIRSDRVLLAQMTPSIGAENVKLPPGTGALNALIGAYWRVARLAVS